MSAIPDRRPAHRVLAVAVAATLTFAAWRVISLGLSDHFAEADPAAATSWRSGHPAALVAAASDAEGAEAVALANRAIAAAPLAGSGYRRLAELAVEAGEPDRAAALYGIAARLAPRDRSAQAWLVDHHLAQGDVAAALASLDPLLRVEPSFVPGAMPLLVLLAQEPAAQEAFAARLATAPPWRRAVLRALPAAATDVDAMSGFYEHLRRANAFGPGDIEPWLARLGREGRWADAYLAWVGQLPADRRDGLGNVADGGFELPPDQGGFGWRFGRVDGARIDRVRDVGKDAGPALRVTFEHRRVPFGHVRQLLALPPGAWRLSGQVRLENLRSERGLVWTVKCATSPARELVSTRVFRGNSEWQGFETEFVVPDDCGAQWLVLRLPARVEAEQRIGGRIWFDDLRIRRIN